MLLYYFLPFLVIVLLIALFVYLLVRFYFLVFSRHDQIRHAPLIKPHFAPDKSKIIMNDGYSLHCQLQTRSKSKYFFICFHGLNGSMNDFGWFTKVARRHAWSFCRFDQRNFGKNPANSSFDFKRNLEDGWAIIKLVKQTDPEVKIILLGHSLGSALITHLTLLPKVRRAVYGYVFTGIVVSRKLYNPFVFLEFNLKNFLSLIIGLFFYSQKVISLRTFNHNRALGVPLRFQKKLYSSLTRRQIPLYFFTQAAYYNYRLVHNFATFPNQMRILITKQTKDRLVDQTHFTTFLARQSKRLRHLKIALAHNVRHTISDDRKAGIKLGRLIEQWIVELEDKKNSAKSTPHKSPNNRVKK